MGIAIGLIGTGIQWRWPEQKGLGAWLIGMGCALLVIAIVAALVRSMTIKEYERQHPALSSALPSSQQLTQTGIDFKPHIEVNPVFNQNQPLEQSPPEREAVRPEVECTDCYFVEAVLSSGNMLDRGNGRPCTVAQADFHLKPIPESDPWIELRTQFIFYSPSGARLKRVPDGVWREQGNVIQMPLNIGDTKKLVIALNFDDACFSTYEYGVEHTRRPRFLTTGEVLHHVLAPKLAPLNAGDLTVKVSLIGKYMNQVRLNQEFWFSLSGTYSLIKQIAPPQGNRKES